MLQASTISQNTSHSLTVRLQSADRQEIGGKARNRAGDRQELEISVGKRETEDETYQEFQPPLLNAPIVII